MKILIIEDNPADAELAKMYILQGDGPRPQIEIAENLQKAIAVLERERFDVLLTDLNLGDASGNQAFRVIAGIDPSLPIVILSGNENESAALEMVADGAQDYINKADLNGKLIRKSLRYAIERKALEENLKEKNRELVSMQEKLVYAAKMESTGHLAAGLALEVKDPLAVIQLGVDCLRTAVQTSPHQRIPAEAKIFQRIEKAVDRADHIIRELLDFGSDSSIQLQQENLNEMIHRALFFMSPQLMKSRIDCHLVLADKLPSFFLDRRKIEQTVINLLLNAEYALEDCDQKRIQVSTFEEGDLVKMLIEDSGPGIDGSELTKVFDAFYSTKAQDEGTGLGLTVVQNIIQLHGGTIDLQKSALGGLRVEIGFPFADSSFSEIEDATALCS